MGLLPTEFTGNTQNHNRFAEQLAHFEGLDRQIDAYEQLRRQLVQRLGLHPCETADVIGQPSGYLILYVCFRESPDDQHHFIK